MFTSGEVFQLKDWPPKDVDGYNQLNEKEKQIKQVNLFHRVKGFYLRYQDIIEPKVVLDIQNNFNENPEKDLPDEGG
mgnify:CR=1 FL=1